jgi:hypothetical protein
MPLNLYRLVRVKTVRETSESFDFSLENSCISFVASKEFLRAKGIATIVSGQEFFIKGKSGNEDVMLARPDALEDIRRG